MKKAKTIKTMGLTFLAGALFMTNSISAYAYEKEETVYVKLNPDGSEKTTIVSEHLKSDHEQSIKDVSDLSDIFNVNGDEPFTQTGKQLTWENKGKDIYYQGKIEKQLPITMKITYQLNGKEQSVDEMLGKAGKVDIRIQYENHETIAVNQRSLPVPFVVTSTTMLPTDKNNHVSVTNGKVISNGSHYVVAALAAPGLDQALTLSDTDTQLNEVTISYETDAFALNRIYAIATPSLLSATDLNLFDRMDQGFSLMDEFSSAYASIRSGGQTLASGSKELAANYEQFDAGVAQLDSQSAVFLKGVETLNEGLQSLDQHMDELQGGLNEVSSNSETLRQGTKQVMDASLQNVNQQLAGLLAQLNQLDQAIPKALTWENYDAVLSAILTNYAQLPPIAPYVGSLQTAKASLDQLNQYYQGVVQYTQGVDTIAANSDPFHQGIKELAQGSAALKQGCLQLTAGTGELNRQSAKVKAATGQLSDGSQKLYEGLVQFDEDGVQKIVSLVHNDFQGNVETVRDLKTAADQYKTFGAAADDVKGSTKFIMIVEAKKK